MRAPTLMAMAAVAVGMAWPTAASAQATPEEAQEIASGFKAWLSQTLRLEDTEVTLVFDGAVDVVPQGDRYLMTIPAATVTVENEVEMAIDPIEVELVPADQDRYLVDWTIPSRLVAHNPRRADESLELTIGSQHGRGLFAPDYATFLDIDMALNDLAVTPSGNEGEITLGSLAMVANSEETAPGIFDSDYSVRIDGFHFAEYDSGDRIDIGSFAIEGDFTDFNLGAYLAFVEEFQAIVDAGEQGTASEQDLVARMQALIDGTPSLMNNSSSRYTLTGLDVDMDGEAFTLEETSLGGEIVGLAGETSNLTIDYSGHGLTITPEPPFSQYMPSQLAIELGLNNVPNDAIIEAMGQALGNMMQMGPESALMMAGMAVQQAMLNIGSEVQVRQFNVIAPTYTIDFQGTASASAASPFGAIANATLIIGNLDQLQQELMASPMTQEPAQAIAIFQAMGVEDVDTEGNPARRFDLELTETGTVLLNGTDLEPILQQMQ